MTVNLLDYDEAHFAIGGNGSDTTSALVGDEQIRYFIQDVAALKYERNAVSATMQMVIYSDPAGLNKNIIVLIGYSGVNASGRKVGVVLPCPPYCGHNFGTEPPAGLKMPATAALIYLNGQFPSP